MRSDAFLFFKPDIFDLFHKISIINLVAATSWVRWHCICHIPIRFHAMSQATWFYLLPCHLHVTPSATHHTTNGTICGKNNFGIYNIFHGTDKTMLFVMVKACLWLKFFLLFRKLEIFVLLIHLYNKLRSLCS